MPALPGNGSPVYWHLVFAGHSRPRRCRRIGWASLVAVVRLYRRHAALLAAVALQFVVGAADAQTCSASSGAQTAALIELYTSEGCSSCPPADAWLREAAGARNRPGSIVPLALHVPYWDYIGWKDIFAQQAFAGRQSRLVGWNGHRGVFTPHFFVSGSEVRDWHGGIAAEIRRINAQTAAVRITISASLSRPGLLTISTEATAPASAEGLELVLAVTENQIVSTVSAGENQGTTLHHDHVVRTLVGPLPMPGGRINEKRELSIDPGWQVAQLGVAAFVQDRHSGRVLQAVSTGSCRLVR
ncbi:hypothetical protein CBW56_01785 [Denitratisoma oestradiolicum]|nr:hypothetical protein CBW56_01785 [Denitratisoma oestradiolicum]